MEPIYLPEQINIEEEDKNSASFSIYPYYPGYGPTVGNALRRVLLSSLPGAAITKVKIEGVDHEFTTLPGVKEDMIGLTLNLKRVRLSSSSAEPVVIKLKVNGEKKITASDFELPAEVSISNGATPIATLTDKKASLELRCTVEQGRGYKPLEMQDSEQEVIGTIVLDAIFTPVVRVSFKVENVRVGQVTDYHKLNIHIETDGTITPKEALNQAASILTDHFKELTGDFENKLTGERPEVVEEKAEIDEEMTQTENTLNLLQLPSRVHNALERVGITAVEQVIDLSEEQIQDIPGLGEKAVHDIIEARDKYAKTHSEEDSK